jgi:signal transduction histidine kinase
VNGTPVCDDPVVPLTPASPVEIAGPPTARIGQRTQWLLTPLFVVTAIVFGIAAYRVQVDNFTPRSWAAAQVVAAWAFSAAGVVAWVRRPRHPLGPLMFAAGLTYLARQLRYSQDAAVFTVFFLLSDLAYALLAHTVLAYPSGHVSGRTRRLLVPAGYITALVFPLAVLLLHGGTEPLLTMGPLRRRSLLVISDQPHAVELLQKTETVVFYGVLAALFVGVLVWRLATAGARERRILAPLLLAAVALALRAVFENVRVFVNHQPFANAELFWWLIAAFVALPLALLAGTLRARLARGNVSGLVLELDRAPPTPATLRDALARTLGDPSLELLFWLPDRDSYVDATGAVASLPTDRRRSVTLLENQGAPVAAIVHDQSLLDEAELVDAAAAAARLALENARLHAETRAQLLEVRESRRRIAVAADDERRRIERNLHDGAQNRLLALALALSSAHDQLATRAVDPELERLLAASVEELQGTVEELRTLARGLHPTVLVEYGLAAALGALTAKSSLEIEREVSGDRFAPEVEATAYFVACEALANTVKHAQATRAVIAVVHEGNMLVVTVADDGIGGARPSRGSGLEGMADRVDALGGRIDIVSPPGEGTRLTARIPCGS